MYHCPGETQSLLLNEPNWIQETVCQYLSFEDPNEIQLHRLVTHCPIPCAACIP